MQDEMLISVIIPVYRNEAYLRRCVDSVLAQTYRTIELILIDDGSPDDCGAICDVYATLDDRVRVIHQINSGVSAARNAGLNNARGEWISFVDSDDWIEPDYLSYLFELLKERNVSISCCNHRVNVNGKDHTKYPVSQRADTFDLRQSFEHILYHLPPDVSPWGKLYRKKVFQFLRYPEGCIFEDTYLIADLIAASGAVVYGSLPKYHYRFYENSISKGALPDRNWDFLNAVDHMTEVVLSLYPDLETGCVRRRVHAALSIRRLLVHTGESANPDINRCLSIIRGGAKVVLRDKRAPMRDKIAILLALSGRRLFDTIWGFYGKIRNNY